MTNKALLEQILAEVTAQGTRIAKLEDEVFKAGKVSVAQTSKKSAKAKSTKTSKKSSAKTTATTKSSNKVADFEPKKDADGNYNYKSWKTCRRNYVANKVGKDLTKEWMDYEEFCKAAAAFDKKYPYVKKSDR